MKRRYERRYSDNNCRNTLPPNDCYNCPRRYSCNQCEPQPYRNERSMVPTAIAISVVAFVTFVIVCNAKTYLQTVNPPESTQPATFHYYEPTTEAETETDNYYYNY